jgi:uncharacterized protein YecE (DUF72 family)
MIRVGIGGWNFAPWRGTFYPKGLKQASELAYASEQVSSIEINSTFYSTQSPASFKKWRDQTPDGFVFSVKGHRVVANTAKLADSGERIDWFLNSGVLELGDKLGPILWQFAPYRKFDADNIGAFLKLLPHEKGGWRLMHALEVRHPSFLVPEFVDLLREHNAAAVFADSDDYPAIADVTADFVYARLQRTSEENETGYSAEDLDKWAAHAKTWESGGTPAGLPTFGKKPARKEKRPVFMYLIAGAKVRNPAGAMALIKRVDR